MPVIRPFQIENPQLGLQPSEIGVESQAAAGRRLGAFSNQVGQSTERFGEMAGREIGSSIRDAGQVLDAYVTHQQVSHGAATFASLTDNLTNQWNDIAKKADPNDPSVAAQFREKVLEPALQKFGESFNTDAGQQWAEHHVEALRQHMFEKTSADMATLAGQAAKVNAAQTINTLSNTVFNDSSALDFALKSLDTSVSGIVGSSPNLRGAAAGAARSEISERGREQIVKAAAIGEITRTAKVPDWVSDPRYSKYVNGIELKAFQKQAEAQQKSNNYYDRQTALLKKQEADANVARGINQVFSDSVSVDPSTNQLRIKPDAMQKVLDIVRSNPDAPTAAAHARTAIDWLQHQQNGVPAVRDDPSVRQDLLGRMDAQNGRTSEIDIRRAEADRKITRQTASELLGLQKAITERPEGDSIKRQRDLFMKNFGRLIDGAMNDAGVHSVLGSQRSYEFEMDARALEEDMRKQGKNPASIYDPRSPDFFGRPENIARYRVSMQQAQEYDKTLKAMDEQNTKQPAPAATAPAPKQPQRVRQNGHIYERQPDGKYKVVQ